MSEQKEVYFGTYCRKCVYKDLNDDEEPCFDCLHEIWNTNSHCPINFEEDFDEE